MGQVTRTNYGCVGNVRILNDRILTLPTNPVILVPGIPGRIIVAPVAMTGGDATLRMHWVGDYVGTGSLDFRIADGDGGNSAPHVKYFANVVSSILNWDDPDDAFCPLSADDIVGSGAGANFISTFIGQPLGLKIVDGAGDLTGGDPENFLDVTFLYWVVKP